MPLRDDLLSPIAGANPSGADLRYEPIYDKIKEARREEDDAPQGDWQHARKVADYPLVIKLASEAIATKSKDLQLGAWLTEAALRRDGFSGFVAGIAMMRGLLEQFWDSVYPELEDGDAELRAAPIDWLGSRLDIPIKSVPLDKGGHDFFKYKESRATPSEADAANDSAKYAAREQAVADGKLTPEDFDKSFEATPKAWYKQLTSDLDAALTEVDSLDGVCGERFGDVAPSFRPLRESITEVQRAAAQLLTKKLEADPDPVAPEPVEAAYGEAPSGGAAAGDASLSAEPTSRADAAAHIASAARFLRTASPHDPAAYLMLRGFRWGELRARGPDPDPKLLEPPATQVRTQLKGLLLDGKWPQLLEVAENVMGSPAGRGWLDLQRYALTALDRLGGEYRFVAAAVRAELRTLLADVPSLPSMTMMDDTPSANLETQGWLRDELAAAPAPAASSSDGESSESTERATETRARGSRSVSDVADEEARAGRPQRAIEILMRELAHEKTPRARFLRKTQVASIMVSAGLEAVAQPILEELMTEIEEHKLDDWESGETVAQPMAQLYRCLEKMDPSSSTKQELYLRICRLDPLQAIGFGTSPA